MGLGGGGGGGEVSRGSMQCCVAVVLLVVCCVSVFFSMPDSGVVFVGPLGVVWVSVLVEEMCISAWLLVFVFGRGGLYSVPSIIAGSKCVIV